MVLHFSLSSFVASTRLIRPGVGANDSPDQSRQGFEQYDLFIGKTTFVNVIASGSFNEDMIPTVGFNMRKITKGNVTIKLWDIGGQPR